jgi:hypothetical protein
MREKLHKNRKIKPLTIDEGIGAEVARKIWAFYGVESVGYPLSVASNLVSLGSG